MTFDQWIDAVDAQVRRRLGGQVRTEEISWDSAMWVGSAGTVVAALDENETGATISFDNGEKVSVPFQRPEAAPEIVSWTIAHHLRSHR